MTCKLQALVGFMRLFNRITLRTPESVELEFTLAGVGSRAYALLIDYNILALLLVGFVLVWTLVSAQLVAYLDTLDINYSGLPNWLVAIAIVVCFAIFVGYFVAFETLWQGQTPGKRIAKIRVIQDDGRPIGLGQATLRALLRPIDDLLSIGLLMIIFGDREKRLGDWAANTLVVQEESQVRNQLLQVDANEAAANALLEQADLRQLLPDEYAVVREFLKRRPMMTKAARASTSARLASQVQQAINLAQRLDLSDEAFLEAVYLAYQKL